jgi:hypothetical protein
VFPKANAQGVQFKSPKVLRLRQDFSEFIGAPNVSVDKMQPIIGQM